MFIGTSILDSSKQHMYRFFFSMTLRSLNMGDNIGMVYTDSDSSVFRTSTDDIYIYEDLKEISDEMDFSG